MNLPTSGTPFIDRPAELAEIAGLLGRDDCRLLTLLGPGGIGKTRLAVEAARHQRARFPNGVFFIAFAPRVTSQQIAVAIAYALKLTFHGAESPEEEVIASLRTKTMLLVLDNFEHLVQDAAVLSRILERAPRVKLLVTTRERLNLQEEWIYTVSALPVPSVDDPGAAEYVAVRLFVQTAQRLQPAFSFEPNRQAVLEICQLVEGMPLGIEIAASHVRLLTCQNIAAEIRRGLDFLATTVRNVPERHRSLRAVFESSWVLLTAEEQSVFRRLSAFRGGFVPAAAEKVTGAALSTLLSLADKSLLSSTGNRFAVHELLRQFAAGKLAANADEMAQVYAAHCRFYAEYLQISETHPFDNARDDVYSELMSDIDNIWAAWDYALLHGEAALIDKFLKPLFRIFDAQSRYKEGEAFFRTAATRLQAQPDGDLDLVQARALLLQAVCGEAVNRFFESERLVKAVLPVFQQQDARWEYQLALRCLARIAYARGNYAEAGEVFGLALQVLQDVDDWGAWASVLFRLSDIAGTLGNYQQAQSILEQCRSYVMQGNRRRAQIRFLITAADLNLKLGQLSLAEADFNTALAYCDQLEARLSSSVVLAGLGRVAYVREQYDQAEAYLRECIGLTDAISHPWGRAFALRHLGKVYQARGDIEAAQQCYTESRNISERIGARSQIAAALRQQASLAVVLGELERAEQDFRLALEIAAALPTPPQILEIFVSLAGVKARAGDITQAVELAAVAVAHPQAEYETRCEAEAVLRSLDLSAEEQRAWIERCRAASLEPLIARLLGTAPAPQPPAPKQPLIEPLSERELEILRLLAAGYSNQEIAEKLVVVVGTVKAHNHNIFSKLGVKNRTQAVARARELKLI